VESARIGRQGVVESVAAVGKVARIFVGGGNDEMFIDDIRRFGAMLEVSFTYCR
jgi:hypothetical protein